MHALFLKHANMRYAGLISLGCYTTGGETICQLFGLGGWQMDLPAHAAGLGPPHKTFFFFPRQISWIWLSSRPGMLQTAALPK